MKRWTLYAALAGTVFGPSCAAAQSLMLSSGIGTQGAAVVLILSLNTPDGASQPAAVQWEFHYSTDLVAAVSLAPGPILAAANKSLSCNLTGPRICAVAGDTLDTIPNGVLATVSVTLAPGAAIAAIDFGNPAAASVDAEPLPLSGFGGLVVAVPPALSCLSPILSYGGLPCATSPFRAGLTAGALRNAVAPADPSISSVSCEQGVLAGGQHTRCEIRLGRPGTSDFEVPVQASSPELLVPAIVSARAGQDRLPFEIGADSGAAPEMTSLEVPLGSQPARTSILLQPAKSPELTVPAELETRPGDRVVVPVGVRDGTGWQISLAAEGLPPRASFDSATGMFTWTPLAGDGGRYEVTFTATRTAGAATVRTMHLLVATGVPTLTELENGAGKGAPPGCSPGAVATLRGHWLYSGGRSIWDRTGASAQLGGTRVWVNGDPVPVLYASTDQVDLVCPRIPAGTPLEMVVETQDGRSNPLKAAMMERTPGLFTTDAGGKRQAIAVRAGTEDLAAIPNDRFRGAPALAGDTLLFDATGIDCSGDSAPFGLTMEVGMDRVPVSSLRPAPGRAGVCRVAVTVPPGPAGDAVPVELQVTGPDGMLTKSNSGWITIERF